LDANAAFSVASTAVILISSPAVNVSPAIFHSGAKFLQCPHLNLNYKNTINIHKKIKELYE